MSQCSGVLQRLSDIIRLDEWEVSPDLVDSPVGGQQLQQVLDAEPVATDTGLPAELGGIDRDAVESGQRLLHGRDCTGAPSDRDAHLRSKIALQAACTITSPKMVAKEFAQTAVETVAYDRAEHRPGTTCVADPAPLQARPRGRAEQSGGWARENRARSLW